MSLAAGVIGGAACTGTAVDLVNRGALDRCTTHNPEISLFRTRFYRYVDFAMEPLTHQGSTSPQFGTTIQFPINRAGDGHINSYYHIVFPGIRGETRQNGQVCNTYPVPSDWCDPCGDGDETNCCQTQPQPEAPSCDLDVCVGVEGPWATWVNAAAMAIIRQSALVIGHNVIDEEVSWSLFFWEELCAQPGKRLGEMIHRYDARPTLIQASMNPLGVNCYLPMRFHHCLHVGNMLALTSMNWHSMAYHIRFAQLTEMIQVDASTTCPVKCSDGLPVTNQDLSVEILTQVIHLDFAERDRLAGATYSNLIRQRQHREISFTASSQFSFKIPMNFSVAFIVFAIQRECQRRYNNWFDFWGKWGYDPLVRFYMRFNNQGRMLALDHMYYRGVMPEAFANLIPTSAVYLVPFCVDCAEPSQPNGSFNASRIEHIEFIGELQPDLVGENLYFLMAAWNWQKFNYDDGLAGTGFSNDVAKSIDAPFEGRFEW